MTNSMLSQTFRSLIRRVLSWHLCTYIYLCFVKCQQEKKETSKQTIKCVPLQSSAHSCFGLIETKTTITRSLARSSLDFSTWCVIIKQSRNPWVSRTYFRANHAGLQVCSHLQRTGRTEMTRFLSAQHSATLNNIKNTPSNQWVSWYYRFWYHQMTFP